MSTHSYRKRSLAPSATVLALSMAVGIATLSWSPTVPADTEAEPVAKASPTTRQTLHKTVEIDGVKVFYREAGRADAPTILLLHGFPTSSHMFRNLIPALSDRFLLDTGHFALEEDGLAIASHIRRFLGQQAASKHGHKQEV